MATIGKVSAVFTASTSGLRTGVNQAAASMSRLEQAARSTANGMRALVAIQGTQLFGSFVSAAVSAASRLAQVASSVGSSIGSAVQQATALGEESSKSAVLFGDAAGEIARFAQGAASIGLAESAALQATGTFGNLFKAMGLGVDVSAEYATTLTQLAADLASFNNTSVEDAVLAIGAALRGEAEPIRRFGVLLDDATLKQAALAAGLTKSTKGSLEPAIKAQAAYAAILRQTTAAQGDFARTSGSLANLGRIVQAQATNIFGDIGKAFQPLFTAATSVISRTLDAVRPFIQEVAQGVASSLSVVGQALANLVPAFEAFLGGLDGGAIGERIADGILTGARFLAQVGDYIITGLPAVFEFAQSVAGSWSTVWEVGRRVFDYLAAVGRSVEFWFKSAGSVLTGLIGRLLNAAGEIAQVVSGGTIGRDIEKSGESLMRLSKTLWDEAGDALNAYGENLSNTVFGRSAMEEAGSSLAGPWESALDAAIGMSSEAARAIEQATASPIQIDQTVTSKVDMGAVKQIVDGIQVAPVVTANVDMAPVKKAVEGVDSRSREGLATMFRIMRGDAGNDVQEQQLIELRRIANNTDDIDPDGMDFDVVDLAPAAGA